MDEFKDRLSQRARDTSRPALAHQCRGRALTETELALKDAMMALFAGQDHDFGKLAEGLTARNVVAPVSGRTNWDEALLLAELGQINADLDAAYQERGYGA
ncbi:recombinase-like helix-turn-helix domain-containing protein [Paracoccus sp. (in: a-proteobacteria)]|uniref:recombinase-like helix-turn-helix domain-containing protein n=1 Tax=Paracoccus sp. TaxID=267 RepID=UPI003A89DF57